MARDYHQGNWMEAPGIGQKVVSAFSEFSCPCGQHKMLALPQAIDSKKCQCGRVYLLKLQILVDEDTLPAE